MAFDRWIDMREAARLASDASVENGGSPISPERMRRRLQRLATRHRGTLLRNVAGEGRGARFEISAQALRALMQSDTSIVDEEIHELRGKNAELEDKLEALRKLFRQRSNEWFRRIRALEEKARESESPQILQRPRKGVLAADPCLPGSASPSRLSSPDTASGAGSNGSTRSAGSSQAATEHTSSSRTTPSRARAVNVGSKSG